MKDTLFVFTYALAGLGHLRVTNALIEAMPEGFNYVLLETNDETIKKLHRATSTHPIIRKIYEWGIDGPLSFFFTRLYKSTLKANTKTLYNQITAVLKGQKQVFKKVVFVSTHFGIAHQIVAIKSKLEKEKGIKVYLVVQVTDDFAHPMWYVSGADLTVVPSELTQDKFREIGKRFGLPEINLSVCPYPVNPYLNQKLSSAELANKAKQLAPADSTPLQISVPVSGAAANLEFYRQIVRHLFTLSQKVFFQVTTKKAPYTLEFLKSIAGSRRVAAYISEIDSDIVAFYDELLEGAVIALEITKPSEQTFKVLLDPATRGGLIMLFSAPFGPQEESNLDFLSRHGLMPNQETHQALWQMPPEADAFRQQAINWRGLLLPLDPRHAAQFILWCLKEGIFSQMLAFRGNTDPSGAQEFWQKIQKMLTS